MKKMEAAAATDGQKKESGLRQIRLDSMFASSSSAAEEKEEGAGLGRRDQGHRVRLLTWNVWFDPRQIEERMRAIDELIVSERPDIVCLQVRPGVFSGYGYCVVHSVQRLEMHVYMYVRVPFFEKKRR